MHSSASAHAPQIDSIWPIEASRLPAASGHVLVGRGTFVYCVAGAVRFACESSQFVVRKGDALWLPPNTSVQAVAIRTTDLVSLVLPWMFQDHHEPFGHQCSPLLRQMMRYLWTAQTGQDSKAPIRPVMQALCELLPEWVDSNYPMALPMPRDPALRSALDWMSEHMDAHTGAAAAARHVGLSVRSFQRRCQRELGMSPITWLQRARILRACELMSQDNQSIAAVAAACGYGSQASFGRVFKAHMGATPANWRHQTGVV